MSRQDLENQAIDWLVELHSGRVEAGRRSAFAQWRAQSPEHESAARNAEALWGALPAASSLWQRPPVSPRWPWRWRCPRRWRACTPTTPPAPASGG